MGQPLEGTSGEHPGGLDPPPGSDLFLVLDTGYITDDTLDPRFDPQFDPWTRRTAVAKLTWLKAF